MKTKWTVVKFNRESGELGMEFSAKDYPELKPLYRPIPEGLYQENKIEFFEPTELLICLMDGFIRYIWFEFRPDCKEEYDQADQMISDYLYQITGIISYSNDFIKDNIDLFSGFATRDLDDRLVFRLSDKSTG